MSDCVIWPSSVSTSGYGVVRDRRNRARYAHRAIWETNRGPIPAGMVICHACDTPLCVNLDHLFVGTKGDNSRDMAAKGRSGAQVHPETLARGTANGAHTHPERRPGAEQHGNAKLTWEEVHEIRAMYPSSNTTQIARVFGVDRSTISAIVRHRAWQLPEGCREVTVDR